MRIRVAAAFALGLILGVGSTMLALRAAGDPMATVTTTGTPAPSIPTLVTCTLRLSMYDMVMQVTGPDAIERCSAYSVQTFDGSRWSVVDDRAMGAGELVCRLSVGQTTFTVVDQGLHIEGNSVCNTLAAQGAIRAP